MHVLDFLHTFLHGLSSQNYIAKLEISINVNRRFLVQILTTKDCKGQQTNVPKNVGSIKTRSAKMKSRQ